MVHHHDVVYGINTGFGPLCTTIISEEDTKKLQYNLLMSHACGMGDVVPKARDATSLSSNGAINKLMADLDPDCPPPHPPPLPPQPCVAGANGDPMPLIG